MAEEKTADNVWVKYNNLGRSGLKVSNICLGTMTFGTPPKSSRPLPKQATEEVAHQILDIFYDRGGNFLDTADVYQDGISETILGNWLKKRQNRDEMVVATKVRFPTGSRTQNRVGLSRKHIMQSIEESLKRLQTDYVDLYQIHCWDRATSVETTFRTLDDLVRAGKLHAIGLSNVTGYQLQKIVDFCKFSGLNEIVSLQPQYNLLCREIEWELSEVCQAETISMLPWSPLKGGWLTGRMVREQQAPPADSRIGWASEDPDARSLQSATAWQRLASKDVTWRVIDCLNDVAAARGLGKRPDGTYKCTPIAINWLLQRDAVDSVIIGAKTVEQLEENMFAGTRFQLSKDEISALNAASAVDVPYPYEMVTRGQGGR